jgi:eukaryotic-like serine/threonine-protein kinase
MKPERWQQLDEMFHAALERGTEERASFLAEACGGDEAMRREVEELLAAHERAGSFIEKPALEVEAQSLAGGQVGSMAGQAIGHYRIVEMIGRGGMGEVYLAQDMALGRRVALKLLPALFTGDAERLRRFEQEARTASVLSHPNIVTIYEIGRSGAAYFIAEEFIDGLTLGEHMASERLKVSEALDVATQVAGALAAAHAKGVVHRDIKPENIMVLREGYSARREKQIKVVDFGIAKLTEARAPDTQAPTRPMVNTEQGVVIGTASYMSPEQARGEKVDARTDIWSLGVVLYEMLAGVSPFAGERPQEVSASILKDEPPPLPLQLPDRLKWIVEKALRKDREERYQTAKEMLSDLRYVREQTGGDESSKERSSPTELAGVAATAGGVGRVEAATRVEAGQTGDAAPRSTSSTEYFVGKIKRHKRGAVAALVIFLFAAAGVGLGLYKFVGRQQSDQAKTVVPPQSMRIVRLTDSGKATAAAISRDGNYAVYAVEDGGKQSLRLRQVASTSEKEIIPPAEIRIMGLTFSPDGNLIYYTAAPKNNMRGILYQVATLGGTPRKVLENVFGPASLSPDGKRLAFIRTSEGAQHIDALIVANTDGTAERTLTTKKDLAYINNGPAWSPDGKTIVYCPGLEPDFLFESVFAIPVEGGEERRITSRKWLNAFRAEWLPDGSGLIVIARDDVTPGSQIWHISYPGGEVRRITNDLTSYMTGDDANHQVSLSITADSSALVALQQDSSSKIWVTAPGEEEARARQITNGKFDGLGGVSWTPDGKILCAMRNGDAQDIWLMNADGTERKQLTADSFTEGRPVMSPDGRYIVFFSDRGGFFHIWRMDADGGNQKQLTEGPGDYAPKFTHDGRWVLFWSYMWSGTPQIGKVPVDGGEVVRMTDYYSGWPALSPDGKLIAAGHVNEKDNSGQFIIIPEGGGQPLKSFDLPQGALPSTGLEWTADGKALTYVDTRNGVSNIWSQPIEGGPPKQITNFGSDLIFRFALSPDGRRLVLARGIQTRDVVLIRGLTAQP